MKKFDFSIGNPPYQESIEATSDKPVYNDFMDAAYTIAEKVELITPARFLFNAGKTPKAWNEKMLADPHLKVIFYEQDSSKIFGNTEIKGGVTVTYRDETKNYGVIGVFTRYAELRSIANKIKPFVEDENLSSIMCLQNRLALDVLYGDYPEYREIISSGGKERRIVSSAFDKLPVFHAKKTNDKQIQILGVANSNSRQYRWVDRKYVEDNGNFRTYKVLIPKVNGSGTLGEILSSPQIAMPQTGYTQSFIGIGAFLTQAEAEAALKYIKTKFARTMLGILKITQDNPPEKWKYVPLQDFTEKSDINWSQSIPEIDQQLYKKYGLTQEEIDFIETHVKEMV